MLAEIRASKNAKVGLPRPRGHLDRAKKIEARERKELEDGTGTIPDVAERDDVGSRRN